jgi:hypothetical protein
MSPIPMVLLPLFFGVGGLLMGNVRMDEDDDGC